MKTMVVLAIGFYGISPGLVGVGAALVVFAAYARHIWKVRCP